MAKKKDDIIPIHEEKSQTTLKTPEELLKEVEFEPQTLEWVNFHVRQPDPDRLVYLWCAFGKLERNLFVTHRNAIGQYDLPHPTKQYPAHAWAYADNPKPVEQFSVNQA